MDSPPEFPGGIKELYKYVETKIHDSISDHTGLDERAFISFVVDKKGRTTNLEIALEGDEQMDHLIVEILKTLPEWKVGRNKGKKVSVQMILPFRY